MGYMPPWASHYNINRNCSFIKVANLIFALKEHHTISGQSNKIYTVFIGISMELKDQSHHSISACIATLIVLIIENKDKLYFIVIGSLQKTQTRGNLTWCRDSMVCRWEEMWWSVYYLYSQWNYSQSTDLPISVTANHSTKALSNV